MLFCYKRISGSSCRGPKEADCGQKGPVDRQPTRDEEARRVSGEDRRSPNEAGDSRPVARRADVRAAIGAPSRPGTRTEKRGSGPTLERAARNSPSPSHLSRQRRRLENDAEEGGGCRCVCEHK
ncbi:Protein of unknown function [Gryllus bimaculatus]|nr:Protein of unknown function [Gryllus bimaculatus]